MKFTFEVTKHGNMIRITKRPTGVEINIPSECVEDVIRKLQEVVK